jgi:subtilisin family serine protease
VEKQGEATLKNIFCITFSFFLSLRANAAYIVKLRSDVRIQPTSTVEHLGFGMILTDKKLPEELVEFQEKDQTVHILLGAKPPKKDPPPPPKPVPPAPVPPSSDDPRQSTQWALKNIDYVEGDYAAAVKVAVIDTGVESTHEDLKSNVLNGFNAIHPELPASDDHGHGTHCAGVISALQKNGKGILGLTKAKILPVKFLSASGSGNLSDAIKGIAWAVKNGATVLSNSWGGGSYSHALYEAISQANEAGVTFVVAAGNETNDNGKKPTYPASYDLPNVISVAASDQKDQLAYFSNFGGNTALLAPGYQILSTFIKNTYQVLSGTSMATPHVAGAVAAYLGEHPNATPVEIKKALIESSDVVSQKGKAIGGRLNLRRLLELK